MNPVRDPFFYLGRVYDTNLNKVMAKPLLYDPADLTTHAVVTGMTGSGKTGLCIGLLEEAALHGIPAIMVDPKGDLTNLLLHFPDLAPNDFLPWLDLETAKDKTSMVLAEETAARWQKGLADWGMNRQDLLELQTSAQFTVFTPGSTAGVPVNIVASFQAPDLPWEENSETLREKISSMVTALLGLVGLSNIDPLRSREHILLSNIIEFSWSQAESLTLDDLILKTQEPPFERLGAFALDNFFPEKDRIELAMLLNNFLASPTFQSWQSGQPLDIEKMLYTSSGKPRHSIFYLAHLSENERMFFVTLLFASIETWMRSQRGTGSLRALVYFDEIMGYLPPVANPPSRPVMLRMLKQARAFGVGLVLATQNPVDLDYKALSNAGTWFVGRLQTEQDKARLLDGLSSAGGSVDTSELDRMISGLQKRVFLLHNVHQPKPVLFQTRWTMNYLAGPLTRAQIPDLIKLSKDSINIEKQPEMTQPQMSKGTVGASGTGSVAVERPSKQFLSSTRSPVPQGINEYFMPNDLGVSEASTSLNLSGEITPQGIVYHPALLAQAEVRYISRPYNLDYSNRSCALLQNQPSGLVRWEDYAFPSINTKNMDSQPLPQAQFSGLPGWLSDARRLKTLENDFLDWVYRNGTIHLRVNQTLKVNSDPNISTAGFRTLCSEAAQKGAEVELDKIELSYRKKLTTLEQKTEKQEMIVKAEEQELNQRRMETGVSIGSTVLKLLGGRRGNISSSISKTRQTQQSKAELEQKRKVLLDLQDQLKSLENEKSNILQETRNRWAEMVNDIVDLPVSPAKKDIYLDIFGVTWLPYYVFKSGSELKEVAAFTANK
jgi:hypothetical protein